MSINVFAKPILSVKDKCKLEYEYNALVHGQWVTISRYSAMNPRERSTNPCFPTTSPLVSRMRVVAVAVGDK